MRILLTNDDGITAPGLGWLYRAAAGLGEIHVVAPADVQSAASHAVTFHRPIHTRRVRVALPSAGSSGISLSPPDSFEGVAIAGRPADCVKLAVAHLLREPVDLVLSGINSGANVGVNLLYSGTVAAAREAAILGLPAVAVSLHMGPPGKNDWGRASMYVAGVLRRLLAHRLEKGTLLNVNIPFLEPGQEPRGLCVVPADLNPLSDTYHQVDQVDQAGGPAFVCDGGLTFRGVTPGSDVEMLFKKYITVTPMHFDTTHAGQTTVWGERLGGSSGEPRR